MIKESTIQALNEWSDRIQEDIDESFDMEKYVNDFEKILKEDPEAMDNPDLKFAYENLKAVCNFD